MSGRKLKFPEGVGPQGAYKDASEAVIKALVAIPECLCAVSERLDVIIEQNETLMLYIERRGKSEGYLSDEDMIAEEEDEGK
jgi:hypothetical protein